MGNTKSHEKIEEIPEGEEGPGNINDFSSEKGKSDFKGSFHKKSMESLSKLSNKTSSSFKMMKMKDVIDVNIFPTLAIIAYLVVVLILLISIGMETWTQRSLTRGQSKIEYTQGPIKRCIRDNGYTECVHINEIDCSLQLNPLLGTQRELTYATNNSPLCFEMKTKLNVSAAFVFLSLIFYVAALIFVIPICKSKALYLASGISALVSTVCLFISLAVYGLIESTFAGFFSVNGEAVSGCLTHGYGLVVAAGALGLFGGMTSFAALIKEWRRQSRMKYEGEVDGDANTTF